MRQCGSKMPCGGDGGGEVSPCRGSQSWHGCAQPGRLSLIPCETGTQPAGLCCRLTTSYCAISRQSSVRGWRLFWSVHFRMLMPACVVLRISSSLQAQGQEQDWSRAGSTGGQHAVHAASVNCLAGKPRQWQQARHHQPGSGCTATGAPLVDQGGRHDDQRPAVGHVVDDGGCRW